MTTPAQPRTPRLATGPTPARLGPLAVAAVPLAALLLVAPAQASDLRQADALGQGGTTRADLDGVGMISDAPAVMALRPRYDVQIGGGLGPQGERLIQAAALDSRTGPVALGLGFARKVHTPPTLPEDLPGWQIPGADTDNPRVEMVAGGALAGAWADRSVSLGLGAWYAGEGSRFGGETHWVEASISGAARVGEVLTIGLSGQNLVPGGFTWLPLTLGGGVRADAEDVFGVGADLAVDLESRDEPALVLATGLDATLAEVLVLRAGYELDEVLGGGAATFGLGATGANGGLDYAMVLGLHGDRPQGLASSRHVLSLRLRL